MLMHHAVIMAYNGTSRGLSRMRHFAVRLAIVSCNKEVVLRTPALSWLSALYYHQLDIVFKNMHLLLLVLAQLNGEIFCGKPSKLAKTLVVSHSSYTKNSLALIE